MFSTYPQLNKILKKQKKKINQKHLKKFNNSKKLFLINFKIIFKYYFLT